MNIADGWLKVAYQIAAQSPDTRTQNSALILNPEGRMVAWAINAFPEGVEDIIERWLKPAKYAYVEHAERAVIYQAARHGVPLEGCTMVSPWAACADCARAIIGCGIARLVTHRHGPMPEAWAESTARGDEMLSEAGVWVITPEPEGPYTAVLRDGKEWQP